MRKLPALVAAALSVLPAVAGAAGGNEPRTLYEFAAKASAVAVVSLGSPKPFPDPLVLVFPVKVEELVRARDGGMPEGAVLVYQLGKDEKDSPPFREGDEILAFLRLLPDYSFWQEKLPNTRRLDLLGDRRYAFRGTEIAEAKRIVGDFLVATEKEGRDRSKAEIHAVVAGLGSPIGVVREDSVLYLSLRPGLSRDFDEADIPIVARYLAGNAPTDEKVRLVDALTLEKVATIRPVLSDLATRTDATGAAALHGLANLGEWPPTDRLLALSTTTTIEVRAFAAEGLGRRAADDSAAMTRVTEILANEQSPAVIEAATRGLGTAGGAKVIRLLAATIERGEQSSLPAGDALATIGGPEATTALKRLLENGSGDAAAAAVKALNEMRPCADCMKILNTEYRSHPDPEVRKLIGIVLGVPLEHKH